jgi:FlaA1/EpsC-like NDP-sugar epimerase
MLGADGIIVVCSLLLAYLFRFDFSPETRYLLQIPYLLAYALPIKLGAFFLFGLYRGMWRYTDVRDFWTLFQACFTSSLILVVLVLYLHRFQGFPRSVFFIDGLLTFVACGGLRVCIRTLYRRKDNLKVGSILTPGFFSGRRAPAKTDVLIIGAGDAGEKILREIIENPELSFNVVGFLDDDLGKIGRSVHGVPVLGTIDDLEAQVHRFRVGLIFIAVPSASGQQMRRIVDACEGTGVSFKTLPGIGEIMDGRVSVTDLREVSFEDLLGREEVRLDSRSIKAYIQGKTVLVTGAGGSIGSELCRQLLPFQPSNLVLLDASEFNLHRITTELEFHFGLSNYTDVLGQVQDRALLEHVFSLYKPQIVFHAAAYKHVPMLEDSPWQAVFNNILGSQVLMQAAVEHAVDRFVVVSTDKAVRPTNVMGASKRVTELLMHRFGNGGPTRFMAVRFGNVVGSSGSVIPLFKEQIARGGPVTVTHPEIKRYFMTIPEAALLILQAGALGNGGEVFVLDMGTQLYIADMARDLIRLMGKRPDDDIEIAYTGLRPGEKLFEELMSEQEDVRPTAHEKILVLDGSSSPVSEHHGFGMTLDEQLQELYGLTENLDEAGIKAQLQIIVPEYTVYDRYREAAGEIAHRKEYGTSGKT